jgi:hypothetical protein
MHLQVSQEVRLVLDCELKLSIFHSRTICNLHPLFFFTIIILFLKFIYSKLKVEGFLSSLSD